MSSSPSQPQASPAQDDPQLDQLLQRIDGLIAGGGKPAANGTTPATGPAPAGPAPAQHPRTSQHPSPPTPPTQNTASPGSRETNASGQGQSGQGQSDQTESQSQQLAIEQTCRFGTQTENRDEPFLPSEPTTFEQAGIAESVVEEIICRYLLGQGEAPGRVIADQVKLPFLMIEPILNRLKYEQMTAYRGSNSVGDYTHTLTDAGRDRARQYCQRTTYFGAAPVPLEHYCEAVKLQSVEGQYPRRDQLLNAFKDLLIDRRMLGKLGPAINSGRGMFLYGYPGNGKTSIAERVTLAFGKYIWIPRAVQVDGEIMRVFDPLMHTVADPESQSGLLKDSVVDQRWVRIKRPTIIAGGELTMDMLEVRKNHENNISEAPLQLKSNCGVLVIDDFGRQKMRVDELLNRWIVPLEKRYDFLNMSSGKKTQVPFDQLVIFSTNLQPKDLVDDAFLRRIPYKIEVENPSETAFRKLFEIMCPITKVPYNGDVIDYLIETHYKPKNRPFRNCHPRDLLLGAELLPVSRSAL